MSRQDNKRREKGSRRKKEKSKRNKFAGRTFTREKKGKSRTRIKRQARDFYEAESFCLDRKPIMPRVAHRHLHFIIMSYDGTQAGQAGPRTIMSPRAKVIISSLPCKSICRYFF